jgi:hypothetical protein
MCISTIKNYHMNKRTLIPVLAVVALISIAYAVYRSLPERITTVENGHEVVYGDPQHGLILGLLLLAGICIWSIVYLATRLDKVVDRPIQQATRVEQPIASSTGSSSYRPLS